MASGAEEPVTVIGLLREPLVGFFLFGAAIFGLLIVTEN